MLLDLGALVITLCKFLLDEETAAHLSVIGVDPSTLVKSKVVAEVLASVHVLQAFKGLVLDLTLVD